MSKSIYYYDIHYKSELQSEIKKIISISEQELDTLLQGLKNCAVSFGNDGEVIKGIDDLEIFKIIQKNYFKENNGEYEMHLYGTSGEIVEIDIDFGEENNVTNQRLIEYNIRGWYYRRMGTIVIEDDILYVDNYALPKLSYGMTRDFLELLLFMVKNKDRTIFSYDELKEALERHKPKYKYLKEKHIDQKYLDNLLTKKILRVRENKNIHDFLQFGESKVSIWKEK